MRSIGSKGRPSQRERRRSFGACHEDSAAPSRGGPSTASRSPSPLAWGGKQSALIHPYSVLAISSFMISFVPP